MNLRQTRERAARPHESFSAWWWWWDCFDTQRWIHSMKLMMNRTRLSLDLSHLISFVGSSTVPEFLTISSSIINNPRIVISPQLKALSKWPSDILHVHCSGMSEISSSLTSLEVEKLHFPLERPPSMFFPSSQRPKKSERIPFAKKECIHTNEAKSKLKNWRLKCPSRPSEAIKREEKKSCKRNFILKLRLLLSNSDPLRGCAWTWNLDLFVCACADIAEMRSRGLRCFAPHSTPNSNMRFTPFVYHSEAHFPLSFAFSSSLFSLLWLYLIISTSAFCLLPLFIQIFFPPSENSNMFSEHRRA